jgi:ribosome-binding protein aMBF1 (putative translation factor)
MKAAQGYVRVGCPGSENPQMCLHCKKPECILDREEYRGRGTTPKVTDEKKVEFGKRLRAARLKRKISTKELGAMTDRVPSAIISWELGRTYPSPVAMDKLIEIFGGEL